MIRLVVDSTAILWMNCWAILQIEKMFYDNGLLLDLYADAWRITGNPLFGRVLFDTGDWVVREMQSMEVGYYSALDTDSEGKEGKFYVWSVEEIKKLLTENALPFVVRKELWRDGRLLAVCKGKTDIS